MVLCGEATVLDVALCIVKGLVVQSLISCVATAVFGEAAAFMLKLVGIGQDTYGLIEAIKSKDPKEIVIATVRLAVSVFTLKSQCFAGDTLVSTEEGNRRIDEIEPGDKVLSYNTETGENELQEVKNVSVSKTDILVHIITDDGRDIETTMFHPFYVKNVKNEDGTGEWKAASNLKAGDELLSEDGKKVKVSEVKVEKLAEEITVYNLELDEVHTYYVAGGVLVHNMCATDNDSDTSDSEGSTNSWDMVEGGGKINGREYSQHAMERMAPDTPQVRAELSRRAEKAATQRGLQVGTQEYYEYCKKYVDPRNIPPSVIEDAISSTKGIPGNRPGTFVHETVDVKIVINSDGKVITVIPK